MFSPVFDEQRGYGLRPFSTLFCFVLFTEAIRRVASNCLSKQNKAEQSRKWAPSKLFYGLPYLLGISPAVNLTELRPAGNADISSQVSAVVDRSIFMSLLQSRTSRAVHCARVRHSRREIGSISTFHRLTKV